MKILIIFLTWVGLWAPIWMVIYLESRYIQKFWVRLIIFIFLLAIPTVITFGYLRPWFDLNF